MNYKLYDLKHNKADRSSVGHLLCRLDKSRNHLGFIVVLSSLGGNIAQTQLWWDLKKCDSNWPLWFCFPSLLLATQWLEQWRCESQSTPSTSIPPAWMYITHVFVSNDQHFHSELDDFDLVGSAVDCYFKTECQIHWSGFLVWHVPNCIDLFDSRECVKVAGLRLHSRSALRRGSHE